MTFRVGQKVVCVLDGDHPERPECRVRWDNDERPVVGEIYTVSSVHLHDDDEVIWLEEIARNAASRLWWGPKVGYGVWRFRPVVERKTDISIFTQILDDVKAK